MPLTPADFASPARRWRVPQDLLHALVWHEGRWRPDTDLDARARKLYIAWNRAPIVGDGRLEDGRNVLEAWFLALGRYGTGREGPVAHAYAHAVLDVLASGGDGRFPAVAVTRPTPAHLSWGRGVFGLPAPWHFAGIAPLPPSRRAVDLPVPYIQQAWDSPDGFDGSGSCGPCALIMALAFFGKLTPRPVEVRESYPHVSPLGGHVPDIDRAVCDPEVGAVHAKMLDFVRPLLPGAALYYDEKATWRRVKAEIDAGRPTVLGTRVTPAGHLIVARGYLADGRLIVNDPAGDQTQAARRNAPWGSYSPTGNRYWNGYGNGAVYEWDALEVRWVMTFGPRNDGADPPEDRFDKRPTR